MDIKRKAVMKLAQNSAFAGFMFTGIFLSMIASIAIKS